ncbi:RNA polymerase sigma factor [Nocardioides marmorisolisilvae]|uniref:RNA polymerase sigma factor n=1 Tax=Nocardioides marmorisolisilvae TaxID=1542737 RepID=A0A3N0DVK2_9ACTN|nr:RNA polymerase sigma factor [Nocardioides marmorisolisilvae]
MRANVVTRPLVEPTGQDADVPDVVSDAATVESVRRGEREALAALFEQYADRLYNHCFRRLGDYADAEDAVSTVFLTVWNRRQRIQLHEGSAAPWLFGVATNVCRNLERGRRRHLRVVAKAGSIDDGEAPDPADGVTDRLADEQRMRALLDQVRTLSRGEQDVLALVVWSGLSYADAAAALDIPVGTVRSRLARARARLSSTEGAGA